MKVVDTTSTIDPIFVYDNLNNLALNPFVFLLLFFLIFYFIMSNRNSSVQTGGSNMSILYIIIIVVLIMLIAANAFKYFFSINVSSYINNIFSEDPKLDIVVDQSNYQPTTSVPIIRFKKQVFNIPDNEYTYNDAKALCKAYGGKLATYEQVENSYNNGGEWCNYGWSDNQLALFPTQKKTYDKLQTIEGHEHDCGRPGVNGGYIDNPRVRFGVNCYGYKPKMTQESKELMNDNSPYTKTRKDTAMDRRVEYWKERINEILVSPFNYDSWVEI